MIPEENKTKEVGKKEEDCDESLVFRDEKTYDKMSRHMSDPNDVITDEDIRNIKTDVTPNTVNKPCDDETGNSTSESKKKEEKKEEGDDSSLLDGQDIESPWTILK